VYLQNRLRRRHGHRSEARMIGVGGNPVDCGVGDLKIEFLRGGSRFPANELEYSGQVVTVRWTVHQHGAWRDWEQDSLGGREPQATFKTDEILRSSHIGRGRSSTLGVVILALENYGLVSNDQQRGVEVNERRGAISEYVDRSVQEGPNILRWSLGCGMNSVFRTSSSVILSWLRSFTA
jgi:hypothetical protein